MKAVSGTGFSSMSDSLIACQPRMLEPSKPKPRSKVSRSSSLGRDGEVLPESGEIHEAQVDHLDFLPVDELQYFLRLLAVCHVRLL